MYWGVGVEHWTVFETRFGRGLVQRPPVLLLIPAVARHYARLHDWPWKCPSHSSYLGRFFWNLVSSECLVCWHWWVLNDSFFFFFWLEGQPPVHFSQKFPPPFTRVLGTDFKWTFLSVAGRAGALPNKPSLSLLPAACVTRCFNSSFLGVVKSRWFKTCAGF